MTRYWHIGTHILAATGSDTYNYWARKGTPYHMKYCAMPLCTISIDTYACPDGYREWVKGAYIADRTDTPWDWVGYFDSPNPVLATHFVKPPGAKLRDELQVLPPGYIDPDLP